MHVRSLLVLILILELVLATQPEPEEVSLSEVYNFLTDDLVARRFFVQIVAQFIFISTGWLVSHEIWRLFNPDTDTDVDLDSLVNFIVTDQRGLGGASISLGYGLTAPIIWILLSQLANPVPSDKRRDGHILVTDPLTGKDLDESGTKNTKISLFGDVLPGMLTKNGVLTRILINGVLSTAFLTFWFVMDMLP